MSSLGKARTTGVDTKDRLLDAAERLFARDGIGAAKIREINELAGQRNPSALHYHFGSRSGVVEAILLRFQTDVDTQVERRLDELERGDRFGIVDLVECVVRPLTEKLDTRSGRDCVRLIPQMLPDLSQNLRRGVARPITPQTRRLLTHLDERMASAGVTEQLRRERLVSYAVVLATLLAERAHHLEARHEPQLDPEAFATHLVSVLEAILTAPVPRPFSTVIGSGTRSRPGAPGR